MSDQQGALDPLLSVPGFWNHLHQSGFFLADFRTDEAVPSRFMSSLGYQGSDFLDGTFFGSIHPSDRPTYTSLWTRVSEGVEEELFVEYRIRTKKGGYRWAQTFCVVLERFPDKKVAKLFGIDRDISLRKQSETLLHSRFVDLERRYLMSESLRIAGSAVTASLDLESTIPAILQQAETLFPFTGARIWAYREGAIELMGGEEEPPEPDHLSPITDALILRVATEKTPLIVDNLANRLGAPTATYQASWIGVPLLLQGETRGVMEFWNGVPGFFRSEHIWPALAFADNVAVGLFNARQYRESQEASEIDPLTGLPSRRKLERLGPEIFRHAQIQNEDLSVFMVDVDNFKAVNDNFGHAQGDEVLLHFSRTCQSILRKGDLVCRYGGDEFVVLLPKTGQGQATLVGLRICELFKDKVFPFQEHKLSLSLGIASLRDGQFRDLKELLEAADTALYQVKSRGRDGILTYRV